VQCCEKAAHFSFFAYPEYHWASGLKNLNIAGVTSVILLILSLNWSA
jgi:hypothetical protein